MPLFGKGGRGGRKNAPIDIDDFKAGVIDTDLDSVSIAHDTLATALAIKTYVDETAGTLVGLSDTAVGTGDTPASSFALGDNNHFQYDGTASKWTNKPYLEFDAISKPNAAGTGEARLYLRALDSANDALAIQLKKATNVVEVLLTSPEAICECGSTDGAKDPIFNFVDSIITVELYCGHSYQMDIPNLRRIQ